MRVILLSGKRFVGKDAVKEILLKLSDNSVGLSLADECKRMYAEANNLDSNRLINDRKYKEIYRNGLTKFYKQSLIENEFFFENHIKSIIESSANDRDMIVIPDIRTKNNLTFFRTLFGDNCISIRINTDDKEKEKRGWVKTSYDSSEIETGLDMVTDWDYIISNNGTVEHLTELTTVIAHDMHNMK